MNKLSEIAQFLNVPIQELQTLPIEILIKMQACIRNDDFLALHHLGYNLK